MSAAQTIQIFKCINVGTENVNINLKTIHTATEKNIVNGGVPDNKPNPSLMSDQIHNGFFKVSEQSTIRYLPNLDSTVLRATGNNVVIMWTPLHIKNSGTVTNN